MVTEDADESLVAGHGRVLTAQGLGLDEVPTLSDEHLTPQQVKACRMTGNRIAQPKFKLQVSLDNDAEQQELFLELRDRGFKVKA